MIYHVNGETQAYTYNISGSSLNVAYDINKNIVYPDESQSRLKVMTYNVGQWYEGGGVNVPADKDAIYYAMHDGILSANRPDILMIEEYWKILSKTGRTAKSMLERYFPYVHEQGGDSGYFGRCICSKYPISDYTVNLYSTEQERYYDSCTVSINGKTITLVVTHLGLSVEAREPQIQELIEYLSNLDSFICCGDYNTPYSWNSTPRSETVTEITQFLSAGFNLANCGDLGNFITSVGTDISSDGLTVPDGVWRGWIDNVSSSSDLVPVAAHVDIRKISELQSGNITKIDHMPFVAEYDLE